MYLLLQVQAMLVTLFPFPSFFRVLLKSRIHMDWNNQRGILKGYENWYKAHQFCYQNSHTNPLVILWRSGDRIIDQVTSSKNGQNVNVNYAILKKKNIVICKTEFFFSPVDEKQLICDSSMILVKREWSLRSFSLVLLWKENHWFS